MNTKLQNSKLKKMKTKVFHVAVIAVYIYVFGECLVNEFIWVIVFSTHLLDAGILNDVINLFVSVTSTSQPNIDFDRK